MWTGDRDHPWAEALAIRDGLIIAVGTRQDVAEFQGRVTRVIHRPTDFAVPGLIDAHGHVEALGARLEQVNLRAVGSLDEVAKRLKDQIARAAPDAWITGGGWDQSLWPGRSFPDAAVLDSVAPNRPVWLRRVDGHAGWANSEALRRANVTGETKTPAGGQILRDSKGLPTGVLIDGAMSLVDRVVPPSRPEDLRRHILEAQKVILAAGLTGVHDAGISEKLAELYHELDRTGQLRLRVYGMASPGSGHEIEFASQPPLRFPPGSRFELRAIKLFMDGAMGSRGALLFAPYHDDPHNLGLSLIDPKVLEGTVAAALEHGWQVATHAIGDRANALVIDGYEAARKSVPQPRDPRLRIEHAQVIRKPDVVRMAKLGIIASMQPSHASSDMRWADARLGPGRVEGAYAWRWFLDGGVPLAFGSDFPVEIVNPFWGLYAAVARQDEDGNPPGGWHPEQALKLEEALRAFTSGAAFAGFAESRVGVLRTGLRADLTVVDRDLFRVSPKELLGARVTLTIIDGQILHERKAK
jgi:predicted amidohydrolase YtcJ